jgi:hypothetical protein
VTEAILEIFLNDVETVKRYTTQFHYQHDMSFKLSRCFDETFVCVDVLVWEKSSYANLFSCVFDSPWVEHLSILFNCQ